MSDRLSRRQFLKTTAGIAFAAGVSAKLEKLTSCAEAGVSSEKVDLAVIKSTSPATATVAAVEALGGIGKFVRSGDVVVIKPNMAFPNPPEWGSTANPEVVLAVVKLCIDGGARSILIIDHPQARPEQCLQRTGVAAACEKLGSKKVRVSMETERRDYREIKLTGANAPVFPFARIPTSEEIPKPEGEAKALEKTEVHKALLRADVLINIPVAKSHSATGVSFSMKNLMGLIWDRKYMHEQIDLHQGIADLSAFIRPSLIVVDATRVLTTRGPEGPGRTEELNTVIAGTDPVAADSYAVTLTRWNNRGYAPKDVGYIKAASAMNLGEMDIKKLNIKKVEL